MKKSHFLIKSKRLQVTALVLLTLWLGSSNASFAQMGTIPLLSLSPQLMQVTTPELLSKFMRKYFDFVEDSRNFQEIDLWQSPEEMLARKKGDCEDYALFASKALTELGFENEVVSIYGKDRFAHTVAFFKQNGLWRVFNDGKLYKYDTATIEEGVAKIHSGWTWFAFTEKRKNRGWLKKIFYNPAAYQPRSI